MLPCRAGRQSLEGYYSHIHIFPKTAFGIVEAAVIFHEINYFRTQLRVLGYLADAGADLRLALRAGLEGAQQREGYLPSRRSCPAGLPVASPPM